MDADVRAVIGRERCARCGWLEKTTVLRLKADTDVRLGSRIV